MAGKDGRKGDRSRRGYGGNPNAYPVGLRRHVVEEVVEHAAAVSAPAASLLARRTARGAGGRDGRWGEAQAARQR